MKTYSSKLAALFPKGIAEIKTLVEQSGQLSTVVIGTDKVLIIRDDDVKFRIGRGGDPIIRANHEYLYDGRGTKLTWTCLRLEDRLKLIDHLIKHYKR